LDGNEDERETRPAYAFKFSEKKHDTAFVLPQHSKRADEIKNRQNAKDAENIGPIYVLPSGWLDDSARRKRRR
jgi:hypothetical protein